MVQLPTLTSVTVAPVTVQTSGVADEKPTARVEDEVALTVNGAALNGWSASGPKVMVWISGFTLKLWITGAAAAKLLLPACEARTVHMPAIRSLTITPDIVHTGRVVEVGMLLVSPEEEVAVRENGAAPKLLVRERAEGVMVWMAGVTVNCPIHRRGGRIVAVTRL